MTKGLEFDFLGLYRHILLDVAVYLPIDQLQWDRDLQRLTSLYNSRGSSVFTIDLPALGKILDRSLANGLLAFEGTVNHSGPRFPGTKIPRLFWGLWSRLFDESGCLKDVVDPNVVLFLRTLLYVGKNFKESCSPRYLYETIREFYDIESALPAPNPNWDSGWETSTLDRTSHLHDFIRQDGSDSIDSTRVDRARTVLGSIQQLADLTSGQLGYFTPHDTFFRHGPGAVSDLSEVCTNTTSLPGQTDLSPSFPGMSSVPPDSD
jgi:hypothetical protein